MQSVLNHTQRAGLENPAPITLLTGLPADNPLRLIDPPSASVPKALDEIKTCVKCTWTINYIQYKTYTGKWACGVAKLQWPQSKDTMLRHTSSQSTSQSEIMLWWGNVLEKTDTDYKYSGEDHTVSSESGRIFYSNVWTC